MYDKKYTCVMKVTAESGPIRAILDEYERVVFDFISVVKPLDQDIYAHIFDIEGKFNSFKSVINHVICGGYAYANYIRHAEGIPDFREVDPIEVIEDLKLDLIDMYDYMRETFKNMMNISESNFKFHKVKVPWDQEYDIEQLLEHAVVHVLRHRRQLEYFWTLLNEDKYPLKLANSRNL